MTRDGALGAWDFQADGQNAVDLDLTLRGRDAVTPSTGTHPAQGPGRGTAARKTEGIALLDVPFGSWVEVQQLSVELWFRSDGDFGTFRGMIGRTDNDPDSAHRPWGVWLLADGKIQACSNIATGPFAQTTASGLDDSRWHHFVWTYDAATGEGAHYLDGVLDNAYSGGGTLEASPQDLRIMGCRDDPTFDGWVAFVAFFGKVLTAAQVRCHYEVVARRVPRAPLVAV